MYVYTQNQLKKKQFKYERLNLNKPFQQINEPYSQTFTQPTRSVSSKIYRSSKSKSSLGSTNASRKELVKAEFFIDQKKIKAERKLQKLKLHEKQFSLQE